MKKIFKLCFITVLSLFLVSCAASSKDVSKMYFYVKDTTAVDDEYYAYSYLTVIPDHEAEILELEFKMVYASADQENFEASAQIAGPYFAEFLNLSALVLDGDLENKSSEDTEGVFEITVDDKYGKRYEFNTLWDDESLENESFKSFYLELVDLLTVESPV